MLKPVAEHRRTCLRSQEDHAQSLTVNTGFGAVPEGQSVHVRLHFLPEFAQLVPSTIVSTAHFRPATEPLQGVRKHWPFSIQMVAATSAWTSHLIHFLVGVVPGSYFSVGEQVGVKYVNPGSFWGALIKPTCEAGL